MSEYDQYEQECSAIRAENQQLLSEFVSWLTAAGLSSTTVDRHRSNVEFYINKFLLYEDATRPPAGVEEISMFLGYWFIRKALWASESSIKSNSTSLKKFYTFMCERGAVSDEALQNLKARIKEDLPEWIATVKRYDDPTIEPEGVWQF